MIWGKTKVDSSWGTTPPPPHTHITYTERGNHGSFGKGEKERAFVSQMTGFIGRKGNVKSGQ